MTPDPARSGLSGEPLGQQSASQDGLVVWVPGDPAPQGSKRYLGRGILVESSKKVQPWRSDIRDAVRSTWDGPPLTGGISVQLHFVMPRPVSTPKRKPTPLAVKKADIDKLERAVFDALTSAGVWLDDKQVCEVRHKTKRLAELGEAPGCWIKVCPLWDGWIPEVAL